MKLLDTLLGRASTPRFITGGRAAPELCMLPIDGHTNSLNPNAQWLVQTKLDGIRGLYIDGQIVTREGSPLGCASHCLGALRELESRFDQPMMFDGEYVAHDGYAATQGEFRAGIGAGVLWLFDAVPLDQWQRNSCSTGTALRLARLQSAFGQGFPKLGFLCPVLLGPKGARRFAEDIWAAGGEGIVIKETDAGYDRRRSTAWRRVKQVFTHDLPVIDIVTQGPRLRTIICRAPDGIGPIRLSNGWSEEDGERFVSCWMARPGADPFPWAAEVSFQITTGTKPSVRGARFHRFRIDKKGDR